MSTRYRHWIIWSLLGFTAFSAGALGAVAAVLLPRPILSSNLTPEEQRFFSDDNSLDYALHILVLGADDPDPANTDKTKQEALQGRSDTVILARFDPQEKTVALLSIPRDTRVDIPDHGISKVNVANNLGGPVLAARTVSDLLGGITIDRYVRLNTEGIQDLIDAMGGVEVYVPEEMKYTDVTQGLYINLEPGLQRLNGEQVHHFIRFRHDQLGDIGRVQRQQELMRAISREMLKPSAWARVPQILQAIKANLDTNLTWEELLSLAKFLLNNSQDSLNMVMLPGRFSQAQEFSTSYWIPDQQGIYQIAVNYFEAIPEYGRPESPPPVQLRIAVQNASGRPGMARRFTNDLQERGFSYVFPIVDDPQVSSTTKIIAQQGDSASAREMQALLGIGEVKVESTGAIESDITVQVGRDWADFWYPEEYLETQQ